MDVMDIIGIVFVALITLGSVGIAIYLFVHYAHPMDKDYRFAYFTKVWIIIGLTFVFVLVFIIPIDFLCTYQL